ncbi:hypothetical protein AVEN_50447-1 [Araneus ventricosus]|uniref:Uncharacterized protein n=1 Tax=Araneus ventricosus TaxID=182803 RepID=A0A4Y2H0T7_ARAVE|nr:hypothetical protein AVEN_50447-1 [Araneus ventricosus]
MSAPMITFSSCNLERSSSSSLIISSRLTAGEEYGEIKVRGLSLFEMLTITVFSPDVKKVGETQDGKVIIPSLPLPNNQLVYWRGRPSILPFLIYISDILLNQEKVLGGHLNDLY